MDDTSLPFLLSCKISPFTICSIIFFNLTCEGEQSMPSQICVTLACGLF